MKQEEIVVIKDNLFITAQIQYGRYFNRHYATKNDIKNYQRHAKSFITTAHFHKKIRNGGYTGHTGGYSLLLQSLLKYNFMKSLTSLLGCLSVIVILGFASCKKNVTNPLTGSSSSSDSVTALLTTGNWIVSSLIQKKEDNTASFAGYVFKFSTSGKLTATKNGIETQGTWNYTPAVTYYGSSSKEAIRISIGTDNPFRRLTGVWNLVSRSSTSVNMDNPEVLEDEHLQIQKQ